MTCTFLGHRDTPSSVEPILRSILIDLIENQNASLFYLGNQGNFDRIAQRVLLQLKENYSYIRFFIVLAYRPSLKNCSDKDNNTIYPEVLETTPLKYAISKRNQWMIDHSDFVVTYIRYTTGGAATSQKIAEKKGKKIIKLSDF